MKHPLLRLASIVTFLVAFFLITSVAHAGITPPPYSNAGARYYSSVSGSGSIYTLSPGQNVGGRPRATQFGLPIHTPDVNTINAISTYVSATDSSDYNSKVFNISTNGTYNIRLNSYGTLSVTTAGPGGAAPYTANVKFYIVKNRGTTGQQIYLATPESSPAVASGGFKMVECDQGNYPSSLYHFASFQCEGDFFALWRGTMSQYVLPATTTIPYTVNYTGSLSLNAGDTISIYGEIQSQTDRYQDTSFVDAVMYSYNLNVSSYNTILDVQKDVPGPTVTLTATPATVNSGSSSTLSWTSNGATSCEGASTGWYGTKSLNGQESTGPLYSDRQYGISCSNSIGQTTTMYTWVTVGDLPNTPTNFTATPGACGSTSLTLSWDAVAGATSYIVKEGTRVVYSGSATTALDSGLAPGSTHNYTVIATNAYGSSNDPRGTGQLYQPPTPATGTVATACVTPSVDITATPMSVSSGGSSTLSWTSANVTSCTATGGWTGSKAISGTQSTGALSSSQTYTIICTGANGNAADSVTVSVATMQTPTGFYAGPSNACANNWINFSWNAVSGATSYTIMEGSRTVYSGTGLSANDYNLVSGSTHTYTITATGPSGTSAPATATATVHAACAGTDACLNIEGTQTNVPPGMYGDTNNNCYNYGCGPGDQCVNITGTQSCVPSGMYQSTDLYCGWEPDQCNNISGIQGSVPSGMYRDGSGDCYTATDQCNNIAGMQATVPSGMLQNGGNCYDYNDFCWNIEGMQYAIPVGMQSDGMGGCVPGTGKKPIFIEF